MSGRVSGGVSVRAKVGATVLASCGAFWGLFLAFGCFLGLVAKAVAISLATLGVSTIKVHEWGRRWG